MDKIEQDRLPPSLSGDDLPTYDDLAAQEGPNSRFGRWRGWIEKRAAERYMTITPEERQRRRERGWGNEEMDALDPEPPTPTTAALSIQTKNLRQSTLSEPPPTARASPPLPPLPPVSTVLRPTHLKMHHFGSRFLPHSTAPIRCLLPLQADRLLLVGHDEGLSVLDMYPQEWNDSGGIDLKGPEDATVRAIWEGESVFQMSILELDNASGVVLMLVGPEPESPLAKDAEAQRTVRMYNLASLVSLAKWAVANKGAHPLNLGTFTAQQTPTKKHRPTSSMVGRGLLKSLIPPTSTQSQTESSSSYQPLLTPQSSLTASASSSRQPSISISATRPPPRSNSDESSWELIDDLPLRWARDFVPLAGAGSRLVNASVLSFALWTRDEGARTGSRGQFLAVATKTNILLYETPPNERAFRFVKEFYTPLQPKTMCFFQQTVHDVARSPGDVHHRHRRSGSHANSSPSNASLTSPGASGRSGSMNGLRPPATTNYGTQLSIFVVFEKKAGWIRLADSAVGEMELFDASDANSLNSPLTHHARTASASPASVRRRHVSSTVDHGAGHGARGPWLPPVRAELPAPLGSVYILTRGATSHVVPCPLPSSTSGGPGIKPLAVLTWRGPPAHVVPRVGVGAGRDVLQLTALGEGSVEVVEVPLVVLGGAGIVAGNGIGNGNGAGKGKGKARAEDPGTNTVLGPVRAEEDAGGETGFLCIGGHWDDPHLGTYTTTASLQRAASDASGRSYESVDSEEVVAKLHREQGIYGWCRKGLTDWRVFWLGGSFVEEEEDE